MSGSLADCRPPAVAVDAAPPHRRKWVRPAVSLGCRLVLAAVFLLAGATKVTNLPAFADRILLHSILPAWIGWPVVVWLPWLELTCGMCLVLGRAVREAAALTAILLVLFLVYGFLSRGETDCGCLLFTHEMSSPSWAWWPIVRELLLLGCCIPVLRGSSASFSSSCPLEQPPRTPTH